VEFLWGREGAKQKPSMGGVWIFSGTTQQYMFTVRRGSTILA